MAIVFLGTLAAGEVMNAYSQPADPQMQINVMPWTTVAVALLLAEMSASLSRRMMAAAAVLALVALSYNVKTFAATRGSDARMLATLKQLERLSDPARTVYVYSGMEGIVSWHFATRTHAWGNGAGACKLGPSPQAVPKFKWIGLLPPIIHNADWTAEKFAEYVKSELDCAFDNGYRVIAGPMWTHFESQIDGWMTLLHARDHGLALLPVLRAYHVRPISSATVDGPDGYVEVTRPYRTTPNEGSRSP